MNLDPEDHGLLDFLFLGSFSRICAKGYRRSQSELLAGLAVFPPACLAPVLAFSKSGVFFGPISCIPASLVPTRILASYPRKCPSTPRRTVQNARTKRPVLARVYPARPLPRKTRNQVVLTGSWVRIPPLPPSKNPVTMRVSGFFFFLTASKNRPLFRSSFHDFWKELFLCLFRIFCRRRNPFAAEIHRLWQCHSLHHCLRRGQL